MDLSVFSMTPEGLRSAYRMPPLLPSLCSGLLPGNAITSAVTVGRRLLEILTER
jgi:hypothetical protein